MLSSQVFEPFQTPAQTLQQDTRRLWEIWATISFFDMQNDKKKMDSWCDDSTVLFPSTSLLPTEDKKDRKPQHGKSVNREAVQSQNWKERWMNNCTSTMGDSGYTESWPKLNHRRVEEEGSSNYHSRGQKRPHTIHQKLQFGDLSGRPKLNIIVKEVVWHLSCKTIV